MKIVLDPTGENVCSPDFRLVKTEVEFLQVDGNTANLFVQGTHLCRWIRELCYIRKLDVEELLSPRERLRSLISDQVDIVNLDVVNRAAEILAKSPALKLPALLTQLTGNDYWSASPTRTHAAQWLFIEIQSELAPLVESVAKIWAATSKDTASKHLYELALPARTKALHDWLTVENDMDGLGVFPLAVEDARAGKLKEIWGQKLRQTTGKAIEKLAAKNPNAKLIACAAYEYFKHQYKHLTPEYLTRFGSFLTATQRDDLRRLVQPALPQCLSSAASVEDVLQWATQDYLPYREWQVRTKSVADNDEVEMLAASFTDWMLENYPILATVSYEQSPLNLRVKYEVEELSKKHQVLWVIVDGLNYPNHQRLLKLLGETEATLRVEQDEQLLAIVPTITEKAKYALTSGLLPSQNQKGEWKIRKVLTASFPHAKYAGNNQTDHLKKFLSDESVSLVYWNMTAIDDCYHQQTDAEAIQNQVQAQLQALAKTISQIVLAAANPDNIAVVIATDHGQMIGPCQRYEVKLKDTDSHGRTADGNPFALNLEIDQPYVKASDGASVFLNDKRFCLDAPLTLALKSFCFSEWAKDSQGQVWGVHGGLSPEEVVVGFSVLRRKPQRNPITAEVEGSGEAGKAGQITLRVDNANLAPLRLLTLIFNQIDKDGPPRVLQISVEGSAQVSVPLIIEQFPPPTAEDKVEIIGTLTYEFDDGVQQECAVSGTLISKQLYSRQGPSLRDRMKKNDH